MGNYAFGVDIGGTAIKIGLFDERGEILDKWSIDTKISEDEQSILRDIFEEILKKLREKGIKKDSVIGVGLGVPGPVLTDGTVNRCVNLKWGRYNVEQTMQSITGFKVKVGNDANVAALGEQWRGGGAGRSSVVMVTLGTGVGGGVILNGDIITGLNGAAGEIGHMHVYDYETEDQCSCGKFGCLEQYTSANGIIRLAKKYMRIHGDAGTKLGKEVPLDSIQIFKSAREGDPTAIGIVNEMFSLLGKSLAAVSCVLDPEAFVIGGGVSKEGRYLIDGIKAAYNKYAFHASRDIEILPAKLGNDAGIYGAARLIFGA